MVSLQNLQYPSQDMVSLSDQLVLPAEVMEAMLIKESLDLHKGGYAVHYWFRAVAWIRLYLHHDLDLTVSEA